MKWKYFYIMTMSRVSRVPDLAGSPWSCWACLWGHLPGRRGSCPRPAGLCVPWPSDASCVLQGFQFIWSSASFFSLYSNIAVFLQLLMETQSPRVTPFSFFLSEMHVTVGSIVYLAPYHLQGNLNIGKAQAPHNILSESRQTGPCTSQKSPLPSTDNTQFLWFSLLFLLIKNFFERHGHNSFLQKSWRWTA